MNLRRKGREYKEKKENIWPTEKRKNRKEKKQIFGQRKYLFHGGGKEQRKKRRKTFGKRKCLVHRGEKERRRKRRKIFGPQRRKNMETEKEQNIWRRKIFIEGKYLEKENIWSAEEMKNGEGKGGNHSDKEN